MNFRTSSQCLGSVLVRFEPEPEPVEPNPNPNRTEPNLGTLVDLAQFVTCAGCYILVFCSDRSYLKIQ